MKRAVFAVLAFIPAVLAVTVVADLANGDPDTSLPKFGAQVALMFASVAAVMSYLIDSFRNSRIPPNKRSEWAVVVFMFSPVALPAYWWRFIR